MKILRNGHKRAGLLGSTNLLGVHLELADDLDGDLAPLAGGISCSVYVTEGAVAHLLKDLPSIETGVLGQFALCLALFCDNALQDFRVDSLTLGCRLLLVLVGGRSLCRSTSLGSDVAVVASSSDRVVAMRGIGMWLVVHYRL